MLARRPAVPQPSNRDGVMVEQAAPHDKLGRLAGHAGRAGGRRLPSLACELAQLGAEVLLEMLAVALDGDVGEQAHLQGLAPRVTGSLRQVYGIVLHGAGGAEAVERGGRCSEAEIGRGAQTALCR